MANPIRLVDAAKWFDNEPWQKEAFEWLQENIHPDAIEEFGWRYRAGPKVRELKTTSLMITSDAGVNLIKNFEGLRLDAYPDPGTGGDPWTIGYGHTKGVNQGDRITREQADMALRFDLSRFESSVHRLIEVPLTQNEFDAIVSFTFNIGAGALQASTFRKRINNLEDKALCFREEFPKWVRGGVNGSKKLAGLVKRRNAEVTLALS